MLKIEIIVGSCGAAELAATGAYLTKLSEISVVSPKRHPGVTGNNPTVAIVDEVAAPQVVKLNVNTTGVLVDVHKLLTVAASLPPAAAQMTEVPDPVVTSSGDPELAPFAAFQQQAVANIAQVFAIPSAALGNGAVSTVAAVPAPTAHVETPVTSTPAPVPALPPVPPVPGAAAQTAAPTNAVPVDKNGLPWDKRIHAESKTKVGDGTWKKRRQVDPELVTSVEAELRQLMGIEAPWPFKAPDVAAVPNVPPLPTASIALPSVPTPTTLINPAPPPPTPPTSEPGASMDFADLMERAVELMGTNPPRLTMESAKAACESVQPGLSLQTLPNRPDLVVAVYDAILARLT